ncbi:hypothetical protein B8V81_4202 [Paenibacillus pasadenensis]|uniref:Uncharacterized protein n=1 Tax=Paenibacillus pasadenensis TaxID=217090 RepID=A0A2N5N5Z0_9BACL|nr:hypothetical protein B8V81_4202 [Paenibacillus pasadenensis]
MLGAPCLVEHVRLPSSSRNRRRIASIRHIIYTQYLTITPKRNKDIFRKLL